MDDLEKELNPREDMENDDDDADDSCDNSSRKEGSSFKLDLIQPICQSKTHFIFHKSAFSPLILFKKIWVYEHMSDNTIQIVIKTVFFK